MKRDSINQALSSIIKANEEHAGGKAKYKSGKINWCFDDEYYNNLTSQLEEEELFDLQGTLDYEIIEPDVDCGSGFEDLAKLAKKWKEITVYWDGSQFQVYRGSPTEVEKSLKDFKV